MTNHNPHTTALPIHAPDQKTKRWAALGVLMLPVLLVSIDNTVLAFAVPAIAKALSPSSAEQLWIVDSYSLVLSALLVPMALSVTASVAASCCSSARPASRQSLRSRHSRPPR